MDVYLYTGQRVRYLIESFFLSWSQIDKLMIRHVLLLKIKIFRTKNKYLVIILLYFQIVDKHKKLTKHI